MMMFHCAHVTLLLASSLFLLAYINTSGAASADTMVVFGDSYSDTGIRWKQTNYTKPLTAFGYWNGRYSDHFNWVDSFASNYSGVKLKNYAVGGATTTFIGIDAAHDNFTVGKQVENYYREKSNISSNRIVVFFSGHNDGPQAASKINLINWVLLPGIIDRISNGNLQYVEEMLKAGEKVVVLAQLMPLDQLPDRNILEQVVLKFAVSKINANMKKGVDSLRKKYPASKVLLWAVNDFVSSLMKNLSKYGMKSKDSCIKYVGSMAFPGNVSLARASCKNPQDYAFWDNVHTSSHTNYYVAGSLFSLLKSNSVL